MKKKIYIIGNSGSGKSYLAKKLSRRLNIAHFDLDNIFWERKYTKKRNEENKKKLLSKIIKENNSWIIEGVFVTFTDEAVEEAIDIIWLDININILTWRIIKREIQKFKQRKSNLKSIFTLIKFARNYKNKDDGYYYKIKELLERHKAKYIVIRNTKQLNNYYNKLITIGIIKTLIK